MAKRRSRPERWREAAGAVFSSLEELRAIQEEYQEWLDMLPENLQNSTLAKKLQTVCDLAIEDALNTASEAESADLPQGFGRD